MDTIAAISTPLGRGGISIIRISGQDSLKIARDIFLCADKSFKRGVNIERRLILGRVKAGRTEDRAFMVYFKAPKSYTGEDMVEFQAHGSTALAAELLKEVLKHGARLAEAGEFTKRSFLNGKVSLSAAEGIMELINAESAAEIRGAGKLIDGALLSAAKEAGGLLAKALAATEVLLAYPEEDISGEDKGFTNFTPNIGGDIEKAEAPLLRLKERAAFSSAAKSGIDVVIIGKTNVGKSSLLNALLDEDRAIVSESAGTTRDMLKERLIINGLKFNLIDTAGIRESRDILENKSIERSKREISKGNIILFVTDISEPSDKDDAKAFSLVKGKENVVIVLNKADKEKRAAVDKSFGGYKVIEVSAEKLINIKELKKLIYDTAVKNELAEDDVLIVNARQQECVENACRSILAAKENLKRGMPELVFEDIKSALDGLGKITGETADEKLIDEIFNNFCLGK